MIILIIMVVLSAYFSASETGIMMINKYKLRHLAKAGYRPAKRIENLLKHPDKLITMILVANNLINISASSLATIVGMKLYGDIGVAISTGILTFIILFFAEMLPKVMATIYPEKIAFFSSLFLNPLQKIMFPLILFFNKITIIFIKIIGIKIPIITTNSITKEELRTIVNDSENKLSRRNQNMLISILDLEKTTVKDIMVPKNEIFGINVNDEWKSIIKQFTHSPYGRIVLYRNTINDIIGVLRICEAYRLMVSTKEFNKKNLIKAADKIYFTHESTLLNIQLMKFQNNNEKINIIINEYGEIQGLITVEDILEEIVGDFTTSISSNMLEEILPRTDGSILIDGTANIREINKTFHWKIPTKTAKTINGLLLEEIGDIPNPNKKIYIKNYCFEIISVNSNIIKEVRITPIKINFIKSKIN